ncbi:MAG: hypothetical protein ACRDUY_02420 [Nitriliruptorales bacterium]
MVDQRAQEHYGRLARYEVFARHHKDPAIAHVGTVRAVDGDDAEVYAYTMYDERRWSELFVAPRDRMIEVIPPD